MGRPPGAKAEISGKGGRAGKGAGVAAKEANPRQVGTERSRSFRPHAHGFLGCFGRQIRCGKCPVLLGWRTSFSQGFIHTPSPLGESLACFESSGLPSVPAAPFN